MRRSLLTSNRRNRRLALAGTAVSVAAALLVVGLTHFYGPNGNAKERVERSSSAVPVSVALVGRQSVPVRVQAVGTIEPFSTVALKARVDGQIVAVNFREGQEIHKGDVLFRLDPRPFEAAFRQAEANALRDAAARDQARSQEKRYEELLARNFVSREAYAQIRTNAQTAEATAQASQAGLDNARLNLEYAVIRAPIDGYLGRALLQVGNLVKGNDVNALVVINQVRPIYAGFAVPEQTLSSIREYSRRAPLAVSALAPEGGQVQAQGRLVFIDNAVDSSTGTIRMRAQFDNHDRKLWPGQFVNVSMTLYEDADAIVIPSIAVQNGPSGQYVFVIKPDLTAEVRPITVARTDADTAIVAQGLDKDERVVVRGALRLSPGARVQIVGDNPAS